ELLARDPRSARLLAHFRRALQESSRLSLPPAGLAADPATRRRVRDHGDDPEGRVTVTVFENDQGDFAVYAKTPESGLDDRIVSVVLVTATERIRTDVQLKAHPDGGCIG